MGIMNKCNNLLSSFYKQIKSPSSVSKSRQPPQIIPSSRTPPSPPPSPSPPINRTMGGASQALKHIPRIKFPQRHPKPSSSSGSVTQTKATPATNEVPSTFFSRSAPSEKTLGGKASLQPKRTPMTQEEIDAIMLGGCL
uniref:formin-like protein 3 n=1 Tax=Erigeron canadensis TaxID=72917 RepID=UPI001CB91DA8|nr:formin-like protein 3 [Erigeron canadensis]